MLTQIWSVTDIIFCHFRPFFALLPNCWTQKLKFGKNVKNTWRYYPFTHAYHKLRSYDTWFLRYKVQRTEFLSVWAIFLPFDLPNNPKNQNFKKLKKSPEDIIILHLRTTNDHHVMYGSWEAECNKHNFLSFWAIFCPSPPPPPPKNPENQNFEKMKKTPGNIIILHMSTTNENHLIYDFWDYRAQQTQFFLIFGPFFALSPPPFLLPVTTQRIKTLTSTGDIILH